MWYEAGKIIDGWNILKGYFSCLFHSLCVIFILIFVFYCLLVHLLGWSWADPDLAVPWGPLSSDLLTSHCLFCLRPSLIDNFHTQTPQHITAGLGDLQPSGTIYDISAIFIGNPSRKLFISGWWSDDDDDELCEPLFLKITINHIQSNDLHIVIRVMLSEPVLSRFPEGLIVWECTLTSDKVLFFLIGINASIELLLLLIFSSALTQPFCTN